MPKEKFIITKQPPNRDYIRIKDFAEYPDLQNTKMYYEEIKEDIPISIRDRNGNTHEDTRDILLVSYEDGRYTQIHFTKAQSMKFKIMWNADDGDSKWFRICDVNTSSGKNGYNFRLEFIKEKKEYDPIANCLGSLRA